MIYIVLVFALIGIWQALMNGTLSEFISGLSLLLSLLLLIIGLAINKIDIKQMLWSLLIVIIFFIYMASSRKGKF